MKVRSILQITAVLGFIFGLGYLIIPETFMSIFGIEANAAAIFAARFMGGTVFGFGVLAWAARNAEGSSTRRAIKLGLFFSFLIGLGLCLWAQLSGFFNAMGWISVGVFLFCTVAFAYFRFVKVGSE